VGGRRVMGRMVCFLPLGEEEDGMGEE
jgi:hypothetical protein